PEQAEQARQLRAVASRLPAVPDAGDPPPRLRERILAAVASVPQDSPQRSAVPGAAATATRFVQARRGRATIIPFLPRASLVWAGADGHVLAVVPFDPAVAGTLAVTIEPAGGSGQPTSAPIFTAKV